MMNPGTDGNVRVLLDCQIPWGMNGGVETFVRGLLKGAGQGADGVELTALIGADNSLPDDIDVTRIRTVRRPPPPLTPKRLMGRLPRGLRDWIHFQLRAFSKPTPPPAPVAVSGEFDVVHFPTQATFEVGVPFLYHPHDLQHLHLPQFFNPWERLCRDRLYRLACERARFVPVVSGWVKRDLVRAFGLPPAKIAIIPFAPIFGSEPNSEGHVAVSDEVRILYPAQTWPHKNHLRLLEAAKILVDRGRRFKLVCTGGLTPHFDVVRERIAALELGGFVEFKGFLDEQSLAEEFRQATAVVVPTLFEAASFPIWEAFHHGKPVACSNVTSLPEQVGDAALVFDPHVPESIADALDRLLLDPVLRADLGRRGAARVKSLSWERTFHDFSILFKASAGRTLSADEQERLNLLTEGTP